MTGKIGGFTHDRDIKNGKDEWLTPPQIIEACGPFDLDPCAPVARPWPTAAEHYTYLDDGLSKPWHGLVWCNPPYGPNTGDWLARCAEHNNCLALVFARTETKAFHSQVWQRATGLLFLRGRLSFHHVTGERGGTAGAPSVLVAYGPVASARIANNAKLAGHYVSLRKDPKPFRGFYKKPWWDALNEI